MINIGRSWQQVLLAVGNTDLRKGIDGLMGMVRSRMEMDPSSGHLFVFSNRGKDRIKLLYFDGSGTWISTKKLCKGRFDWPEEMEGITKIILSVAEFIALVDGLQLTQSRAKMWWRKKVNEMTQTVEK
jgi:transposase